MGAPEAGPESVGRLAAGRTVTTAESCTAGRIATRLAAEDGASDFLLGGIVAYHEETKRSLLGVRAASIYCEEAAEQMAAGACALTGADAAVATSGIAGPDPIDGVAPGTVFVAVRVDGATTARTYRFAGTADEICGRATEQALADLVAALRRPFASGRFTPGAVVVAASIRRGATRPSTRRRAPPGGRRRHG